MRGSTWKANYAGIILCVCAMSAHGQSLRMGAVGASGGVAEGNKHGMRSLVGQATAGIPVSKNYRHGVGFLFADTEIKIPNASEDTETFPDEVPIRFDLRQNYPNPFNPSTTIVYDVPGATHVMVDVFNILGQRMAVLVNERQAAGTHKVVWNARDDTGGPASSGVYLYRIVAGDFVKTRTMTLVK